MQNTAAVFDTDLDGKVRLSNCLPVCLSSLFSGRRRCGCAVYNMWMLDLHLLEFASSFPASLTMWVGPYAACMPDTCMCQ